MLRETVVRDRLQGLAAASGEGPIDPEYLELKEELQNIQLRRAKGAVLRAKARYAVEDEHSTGYFFGLEKAKQSKFNIESLKDKSGRLESTTDKILELICDFYTDLFNSEGVNEVSESQALNALDTRLSMSDADF